MTDERTNAGSTAVVGWVELPELRNAHEMPAYERPRGTYSHAWDFVLNRDALLGLSREAVMALCAAKHD